MSKKSEVSQSYMESQKKQHCWKPNSMFPNVLITGDKRPGSIGEAIRLSLPRSDVTSFDYDITKQFDMSLSQFDTLIMCHGAMHLDWFELAPLDELAHVVDVNLTGTINLTHKFVRHTINNPVRKRIISIGSMAYTKVLNGSAVYCASKAGLAMFMKCLAWELAPKGFDVFSIHPSNTADTPMSNETIEGLMRYRNLSCEEATAYWNDSIPRDKILSREDIAELVVFLLSSRASSYLSGTNLELAGGQR